MKKPLALVLLSPVAAVGAAELLSIALTIALASLTAEAAAQTPARRPNLLLLVSDDQRWDAMGCAGNALARTPNLDALAADGVRFRNAFVTTSIYAASRASIFTGLHERTHRYTFGTPPLRDEHPTSPATGRSSSWTAASLANRGACR